MHHYYQTELLSSSNPGNNDRILHSIITKQSRERMNKYLSVLLALSLILVSCSSNREEEGSSPAERMNIIVLFADDISARELPIYGSTVWSPAPQGGNSSDLKFRAETPVLDQLAEEGVWIKTAWASTVCMPSRAMMMTGRYAHIHKWWNNKDKGTWINPEGKKETYPIYESSPHTNAFIAKTAGYDTYWAGKTQMSGVEHFGFDEGVFTAGANGWENNRNYPYSDFKIVQKNIDGKNVLINEDTQVEVDYYQQFGWYWQPHVELMNHPDNTDLFEWWPNNEDDKAAYGLNTYGPDIVLRHTLDFMERKVKEGKPFFVYHCSHLGHDGWDFFSPDINPETRQKWPATPKIKWEDGQYSRTDPYITGDSGIYDTHGSISDPGIHAHINYLDYQVWQYMEKLKELGIADNTIFIFSADNGTSKYGKNSPVSQRGVHVPLIIWAPGINMTKKGEQDVLASLADIVPTIADLAGVKVPDSYEINGESLIPFLTTDKKEHRDWIYSYHKELQLIRGKYVMQDGPGKIYDVSKCPDDLISFPIIEDWDKYSSEYREEFEELMSILPRYDLHETERNAPEARVEVDALNLIH